jgi:GntR family transcriptional regulator
MAKLSEGRVGGLHAGDDSRADFVPAARHRSLLELLTPSFSFALAGATPKLYGCTNTISTAQNSLRETTGRVQIHISASDGVAIYVQIVNQVKYLVASGRLTPGAELPPIRVLAERLLINPSTVARAYRELEAAGIVEKRRTAGTYVSDQGSPLARRERVKILTERIDALLAEARQMNFALEDVMKLVEQRNAAMQASAPEE